MEIITEILVSFFDIILGPTKIFAYPDSPQIDQKLVDFVVNSAVLNFQLKNPPTHHPIYLSLTDFQKKGIMYVKRMPPPKPGVRPNEFMLFLLVKEQDIAILYKFEPDLSSFVVKFLASFFKSPIFLSPDFMKNIPNIADKLNAELVAFATRINIHLQEFMRLENKIISQSPFPIPAPQSTKKLEISFKTAVFGDSSVGKSSILLQYADRKFRRSYIPTVGGNITEKKIEKAYVTMNMMIWDLGGTVRTNAIRNQYYSGVAGCLLLFDLTILESFKSISDWYDDLKTNFAQNQVPIILVGNKSDLKTDRKVPPETIQQFLDQTHLKYIETSAKSGQNIDSAFDLLIAEIIKQLPNYL